MSASALKRLVACFLLASMTVLANAGTVTGTIQKPNTQPLANGVISFALSQAGVTQAGSITLTSDTSYCGTSSTGIVVGITDPGIADVLSANYGAGTLPAATYYVEYTYTSASGESFTSPENIFLMTGSGTLNGNAPTVQPANATGYKVYIGTTSGGETLQTTVTGFAGWSQSTTLAAGATPPVSNTTLCNTLFFNDSIIPSYTTYLVNLVDGQGKQVSGYPQRYYLQGTSVDLSTLAPAGNVYARFPSAIVAQPSGNGLQSISGPLSISGLLSALSGINVTGNLTLLTPGSRICWTGSLCFSLNGGSQLVWPTDLLLGPTGGANVNVNFGVVANGLSAGNPLLITGGAGTTTGAGVTVAGASGVSGNGGNVAMNGGAGGGSGNGGSSVLQGGNGGTSGPGGAANVVAGNGGGAAIGGGVTLASGNGGSSGSGGDLTLTSGNGNGAGNGGNIVMNTGSGTAHGAIQVNGILSKYNSTALVGNGIPAEYATVDLTAQTAAITTTTLTGISPTSAGQYRVSWNAKVTTAAGVSSTLGALTIVYTDPDGVTQTITAPATIAAGTIATTSTGNTTSTVLIGIPLLLNCKASTNITYAFAYASNAANAMQYNLHIRVEGL